MKRLFIVIHSRGCDDARGHSPERALVNAHIPGGIRNAVAVIAKDLVATPRRSGGAYTALIGNLVAGGRQKP